MEAPGLGVQRGGRHGGQGAGSLTVTPLRDCSALAVLQVCCREGSFPPTSAREAFGIACCWAWKNPTGGFVQ